MAEDLTKRLYVENVEAWKNCLSKKRFSDRKLEVKVVERGIVLPARPLDNGTYKGGVCDNDFNFVAGFSKIDPNERVSGGGVEFSRSFIYCRPKRTCSAR